MKEELEKILLIYTKWLKEHEFVVTMNKPDALVTSFIKNIIKSKNEKTEKADN